MFLEELFATFAEKWAKFRRFMSEPNVGIENDSLALYAPLDKRNELIKFVNVSKRDLEMRPPLLCSEYLSLFEFPKSKSEREEFARQVKQDKFGHHLRETKTKAALEDLQRKAKDNCVAYSMAHLTCLKEGSFLDRTLGCHGTKLILDQCVACQAFILKELGYHKYVLANAPPNDRARVQLLADSVFERDVVSLQPEIARPVS